MTLQDAVTRLKSVPNTRVPDWRWAAEKTLTGYEYRTPDARTCAIVAGLDVSVACLAAVAASEFPANYPAYTLAGLRCVINDCQDRPKPISIESRVTMLGLRRLGLLSYPKAGHFGRQSGRWCSSFAAPTLRGVEAAKLAMQGVGEELARGGRRWCDLKVMNGGVQGGEKLKHDARSLIKKWYGEGWRWVGHAAELDPYILMVFGRTGVPLVDALAVEEDGRMRWHRA